MVHGFFPQLVPKKQKLFKWFSPLCSHRLTRADKTYSYGDWSFSKKFSSKATWNLLRERSPVITWSNLIWFKEAVPRFSFVSWMSILARLPTRDMLISWGMTVPASCPLCSTGLESHAHLFFSCLVSLFWLDVFGSTGIFRLCSGHHWPASGYLMLWCSSCY